MSKKISVIIVHWNTPKVLKKQLEILDGGNFQIIVIDNNSDDDLAWVGADYPKVQLIQNEHNFGYSFACNQGATRSIGEWLLFLNPDVEIAPDEIDKFINIAEDNNYDAACPITESENYRKPLPTTLSIIAEFTPLNRILPLSIFKTKTLFGGCLLIRKEVLISLGGWDERFFLWFEDSDLTKRLLNINRKIGWASVHIKHIGADTFKQVDNATKKTIFFSSLKLYSDKHFKLIQKLIAKIIASRFSKKNLLPQLDESACVIVPNLRKNLLIEFFKNNNLYLQNKYQLIIVTSSLSKTEFFEFKTKYPNVRFILIDQNKGFANTVNLGFKASTGKYLATVNDDTVAKNDWIDEILKYDNDSVGSMNPIVKSKDNSIESIGIKVFSMGKAKTITEFDSKSNYVFVDATNGASVVYKKIALDKVGLFDERFGSYLEDIDLSLRLSRNGFKNIAVTTASIIHLKHQTTKHNNPWEKNCLDAKNWILVIAKNWGFKNIITNLPLIFIERLRNLSGIIKNLHVRV